MRMVTIPYLNWTLPRLALELAIVAAVALGVALVWVAVRMWADCRADERAWEAEHAEAGWDDHAQAAALQIAAESRWREDLAQIHADELAIDQWRDAGYPADRQPYAITAAEQRSDENRARQRRLSLAAAETLVRLAA